MPSPHDGLSAHQSTGGISATGHDSYVSGLQPMHRLDALKAITRKLRRNIVTMIAEAGSGHPGGSLSAVEIVTSHYFEVLRHRPDEPCWPERDRFILSKAHACPVLYAALAEAGYFPEEELMTFRKVNSRLQGHAHIKTPGVEMSGGSLVRDSPSE